ncbi:MAG: peptidylprolyl isomerase [Myxococcota bacterium]
MGRLGTGTGRPDGGDGRLTGTPKPPGPHDTRGGARWDASTSGASPSADAVAVDIVHVLVSYRGALRATPDVTRTRHEARALAQHLLTRARACEPLGEIASAWSDEPFGRRHAGRVHVPSPNLFAPFAPAFAMGPGDLADIIESDYGFHLVQRIR